MLTFCLHPASIRKVFIDECFYRFMEVTGLKHLNLHSGWIIAIEEFHQEDLLQLVDLVSELEIPKINCPDFVKKRSQFIHAIYADSEKHFSFLYRPGMNSALIIWKNAKYSGSDLMSMLLSITSYHNS